MDDDKIKNEINENIVKKNSSNPSNDENDKELSQLKSLVNKLLNDNRKKGYDKYELDFAYSLKNKDFSLNFEKRAQNEETLYGYYRLDDYDEKKLEEIIIRLKDKSFQEIEHEIMVSSPVNYHEYISLDIIIICRFILGKNVGLNQKEELSEKDKEKYLKKNYDTVYRVNRNINSMNPTKKYNILKKENIELLYLVKLKNTI